jgi:hypothetical protein
MQQSSWLKDNIFIVAAVVLPLVVAALFLVATALPRFFVEPPTYALLVAIDDRSPNRSGYGIEFEVTSNRLTARALYSNSKGYFKQSHVYRYTPGAEQLEHVEVVIDEALRAELQADAENKKKTDSQLTLPLPEALADLELITTTTAPDGYRFRSDYRGGAGLFGALFGMRSRQYAVAIEKQGRVVELGAELEQLHGYAWYNVHFLGWIARD